MADDPIDPADVAVATQALRSEADMWREQSATLASAAALVETLRISQADLGVLFPMHDTIELVIGVVNGRCTGGHDRMVEIATALGWVADVYDDEERTNTHRLNNLY